jgi:hypothetical protein
LAGEVAAVALGVGGGNGDVQPGEADGLAGVGEASDVAELGQTLTAVSQPIP